MNSNNSNSNEIVSMNSNDVASREELRKKLEADIAAFTGRITAVQQGASGYEWIVLSNVGGGKRGKKRGKLV